MARCFHLPLAVLVTGCATMSPEPGDLLKAKALVERSVSEPVGVDVHHSQGIVVLDDVFYLTSVNKEAKEGYIFRFDRETMALQAKRDLAIGEDIHPGGMDSDGRYLWVPVATYARNSHACILALDPETFAEAKRFEWNDHIGALVRYQDLLIGANWDAKDFYFWTLDGQLVEKRENPLGIAYQDCQTVGDYLLGVGGGYLDCIDIKSWTLAKRFPLGESRQGRKLSREGMSLRGGSVFLLPDDGPDARLYEFTIQR